MSSGNKPGRGINWVEVGKRVRSLRGLLTQSEYAKKIGVSQGYLSDIERGNKEVGPEVLLRIREDSSRSVDWILTGQK